MPSLPFTAFRTVGLALVLFLVLAATRVSLAQGSLTPPGAPGPTMKSLAELDTSLTALASKTEARVAIDTLPGDATARHIISTPGSYFLRGNVTSGSNTMSAIRITASGVVLDLNGFGLIGTGAPSTAAAIEAQGLFPRRVVIRNGTISSWLSGLRGPSTALVSDLHVEDCTGTGIELGQDSIVRNVHVYNVGHLGIAAGTVEACRVKTLSSPLGATGINAATVRGCDVSQVTATGSGIAYGIIGDSVVDCRVINVFTAAGAWGIDASQWNRGNVRGCIVEGIASSASAGAIYGISSVHVSECLVKTLQGSNDAVSGITASSVDHCAVSNIALTNPASVINGIDADTVTNSRVDGLSGSSATTTGIKATIVTGNQVNFLITATGNAYGIQLTSAGQARGNAVSGVRTTGIYAPLAHAFIADNAIRNIGTASGVTTGAGILVSAAGCRVENNTIGGGGGCDYGIRATVSQNLIVGNRCTGSFSGAATGAAGVDTPEFNIAAGNRFGAIVGIFAANGEITASNPFANFSD